MNLADKNLPEWEFKPSLFEQLKILPFTWEEFVDVWSRYWDVFFEAQMFSDYMILVGDVLYYGSQGLLILTPIVLLLKLLIDKFLNEENNDYDKESKALQRMKRIADKTYIPLKHWLREYEKEYKYRKVMHGERDGRHLNEKVYPNPNRRDKEPMYIAKRVRHDEKKYFGKKYPWKYKK